MKLRQMKFKCDICGKPLTEDSALFAVMRVDPFTKILRKPTDEELALTPVNFQEAAQHGYFLGQMCEECSNSKGYERAEDDEG